MHSLTAKRGSEWFKTDAFGGVGSINVGIVSGKGGPESIQYTIEAMRICLRMTRIGYIYAAPLPPKLCSLLCASKSFPFLPFLLPRNVFRLHGSHKAHTPTPNEALRNTVRSGQNVIPVTHSTLYLKHYTAP